SFALAADGSSMTPSATLNVPANLTTAPLTVTGQVQGNGQFSLSVTANVNIAGFPVTPTFTLTNTSLTIGATLTIPALNNSTITVSGTIQRNGAWYLTANNAPLVIDGYTITSQIMLTRNYLNVQGSVSVPNFGDVDFEGGITYSGEWSLSGSGSTTING